MNKLTVVILTYNLEKYVGDAIESVLKQKIKFPVRIIVEDDASTDCTVSVIKKYQRENPEIIELYENEINGGCLKNSNRAFSKLTSEYFMLLDGDDFLLDEHMLQKAIDFLDENKDFAIWAGNVVMSRNNEYQEKVIDKRKTNCSYNFDDFLQKKVPYVHPSGTVFRNVVFNNGVPEVFFKVEDTFENCACRGDSFRFILHMEQGKLKVVPEVVSCYRVHETNIWQKQSELKRRIETAIACNFFDKYFSELSTDYFNYRLVRAYRRLMTFLVDSRNIKERYNVTKEESNLLIAFLQDISEREIDWNVDTSQNEKKPARRNNLVKRVIRKIKKFLK